MRLACSIYKWMGGLRGRRGGGSRTDKSIEYQNWLLPQRVVTRSLPKSARPKKGENLTMRLTLFLSPPLLYKAAPDKAKKNNTQWAFQALFSFLPRPPSPPPPPPHVTAITMGWEGRERCGCSGCVRTGCHNPPVLPFESPLYLISGFIPTLSISNSIKSMMITT